MAQPRMAQPEQVLYAGEMCERAAVLFDMGRTAEAGELFQKLLIPKSTPLPPTDEVVARALCYLGRIAQQSGQHETAVEYFNQSVQRKNPDAAFFLANCEAQGKGTVMDFESARSHYHMAIVRSTEFRDQACLTLSDLFQKNSFSLPPDMSPSEAALQCCEEAVKHNPQQPSPKLLYHMADLAVTILTQGGDKTYFSQQAQVWLNLAIAFGQEAEMFFEMASAHFVWAKLSIFLSTHSDTDGESRQHRAEVLSHFDQAIELCVRATEKTPDASVRKQARELKILTETSKSKYERKLAQQADTQRRDSRPPLRPTPETARSAAQAAPSAPARATVAQRPPSALPPHAHVTPLYAGPASSSQFVGPASSAPSLITTQAPIVAPPSYPGPTGQASREHALPPATMAPLRAGTSTTSFALPLSASPGGPAPWMPAGPHIVSAVPPASVHGLSSSLGPAHARDSFAAPGPTSTAAQPALAQAYHPSSAPAARPAPGNLLPGPPYAMAPGPFATPLFALPPFTTAPPAAAPSATMASPAGAVHPMLAMCGPSATVAPMVPPWHPAPHPPLHGAANSAALPAAPYSTSVPVMGPALAPFSSQSSFPYGALPPPLALAQSAARVPGPSAPPAQPPTMPWQQPWGLTPLPAPSPASGQPPRVAPAPGPNPGSPLTLPGQPTPAALGDSPLAAPLQQQPVSPASAAKSSLQTSASVQAVDPPPPPLTLPHSTVTPMVSKQQHQAQQASELPKQVASLSSVLPLQNSSAAPASAAPPEISVNTKPGSGASDSSFAAASPAAASPAAAADAAPIALGRHEPSLIAQPVPTAPPSVNAPPRVLPFVGSITPALSLRQGHPGETLAERVARVSTSAYDFARAADVDLRRVHPHVDVFIATSGSDSLDSAILLQEELLKVGVSSYLGGEHHRDSPTKVASIISDCSLVVLLRTKSFDVDAHLPQAARERPLFVLKLGPASVPQTRRYFSQHKQAHIGEYPQGQKTLPTPLSQPLPEQLIPWIRSTLQRAKTTM